jgi:hypothetical protein
MGVDMMPTTRIADIVAIASRLSGVSVEDIKARYGGNRKTMVRAAVCFVAADVGNSTPLIGGALDGRDHSTVISSINRATAIAQRNPEYAHFLHRLAEEARNAEPFLDGWGEQYEFAIPVKEPEPKPRKVKPKNDFTVNDETADNGHKFATDLSSKNARFVRALIEARGMA